MRRALLLLLASAGVALAAERLLPFEPLADAKKGESARYTLEILDASGRSVSKTERTWTVDAHEDGTVSIGRAELNEDADAAEIVKALRLLPPGTPLDGLAAKAAEVALPGGKKAQGVEVKLRAELQGGATTVVFESAFAKEVAVYGLLRARTQILGGGAGTSVYELVESSEGR